MVAVAAKSSSQPFGISTPAFSKVVALKKKTRPVVETERPCRTPVHRAGVEIALHPIATDRSPSTCADRRSRSPFLENSGSHGQLTCTMSASVPPAIWVVSFSR